MPGFIDVLNLVPQFHGFIQLWAAPGTGEGALFVGVMAMIRSVQKRFVHFFFHTTGTEGKEQFVTMTVRQHGMVQFTGRQDFALDEAKVLVDVRVTRLRIDGGMSFGVHRVLVDPRVQGGDIDVVNFLARGDMMVEFDGIGTTSTESLSRFKGLDEVEFPDEGVHLWLGF